MSKPMEFAMTSAYRWRLHRNVLIYVAFLLGLIGAMAWAERSGLSRNLIGPIFLFSTVMIYALIGISARTTDEDEYYVAGRRIPAMYNGMATAADWMSAASFISLAGALYLQGFSGSGNCQAHSCWYFEAVRPAPARKEPASVSTAARAKRRGKLSG